MWTLLFLCCVLTTHSVQGAGRWYTSYTAAQTTSEPEATTYRPSCRYNCGYSMGSCSCSSSCQYYGNCCHDYNRYCAPDTPTDQPSCRYNCGYYMGSCSCRSSCSYYGNCCHDYNRYCYDTSEAPTTTNSPTSPIDQPSCRYNCGYYMGSCSCRSSCSYYGNCCHDYNRYCYYSTEATITSEIPSIPTGQPSCRYNCGRHMGSCSCSSSCSYYGNCCHDYNRYCYSYHSTHSPEYTTDQPSCRGSCNRDMGSCSCRYSCYHNGNCCHDYGRYCSYYSTEAPATDQPSCRYNCGYHIGSCSCSSSCQYYGNCCHDYYSYCYTTTHWPHITHWPQWSTPGKPCGGYLFGSGVISSPNHPDHYNDHSYCVWQLRAAHDQRIYISFDFVELENCCTCDYVSVHDGSSTGSRLLGKVCDGNGASFFSTYQYMTVVFRTDSAVVARGFKAEFMSTLRSSSGRVECSSESMNIFISRSYLNSLGYDGSDLYLNDPSCRPSYNSNYEVVFSYSITSCGNVKKIDNGTVVYTNNVGAYNSSSSSFSEITRQSHFELNINCRMEKNSVSQIVYIVSNSGSNSIIGSGKFNTSMDFYTSSSFYDKVTQRPYTVSLNEYMYVQVNLWNPSGGLVIFIDTCVASPSADDFSSRPYYLVRDGCRADSTYHAYISGTRSYARFTFKSFQFLRATKSVYIQCTVLICPDSDNNSRCRRNSCTRRTARDLGSYHDSQTLVLGPIQLKEPEKKEEGSDEQSKA